jgi:hypothetical protein
VLSRSVTYGDPVPFPHVHPFVHVSFDISDNNGLWSIPSNPVVVKVSTLLPPPARWVIVVEDLIDVFGVP